MPPSASLDPVFQALSEPNRRSMLSTLRRGPASVTALAAPLDITLAAVVQHLQVLERAGLVHSSKAGRVRTCTLTSRALQAANVWIAKYLPGTSVPTALPPAAEQRRPARTPRSGTPAHGSATGERRSIEFSIERCSLGHVLVAATPAGLCAVLLGDDREALQAELQRRFPEVTLVPAGSALQRQASRVRRAIEQPTRKVTLPLDLHGTAFQQRVWRALQRIPSGRTTSYGQLARSLGMPRAVRAVASACGANPVAVLIPCHRVLGSDGKLTGYRWGLQRKRALLEREAQN